MKPLAFILDDQMEGKMIETLSGKGDSENPLGNLRKLGDQISKINKTRTGELKHCQMAPAIVRTHNWGISADIATGPIDQKVELEIRQEFHEIMELAQRLEYERKLEAARFSQMMKFIDPKIPNGIILD